MPRRTSPGLEIRNPTEVNVQCTTDVQYILNVKYSLEKISISYKNLTLLEALLDNIYYISSMPITSHAQKDRIMLYDAVCCVVVKSHDVVFCKVLIAHV